MSDRNEDSLISIENNFLSDTENYQKEETNQNDSLYSDESKESNR